MYLKNKINYFEDRCNALRNEVTEAIIELLKENNLTEIKLSRQPDNVPWVVWFNNENYGYDSRVTNVSLYGNGISVEVYDEDCCQSETLTSDDSDLACSNIDWLCKILNCITYTLSLPNSSGITTIFNQLIEWSYDEPGLSELPEDDLCQIESELQNGECEGELCYYNDNEVEFNGKWKIKN